MRTHSSSMLRSIWLIWSSISRTCWARPESASISAVTASLTCFSTSPPMASRWLRTSSSSALNCWEMCWVRLSLLIIGSLRENPGRVRRAHHRAAAAGARSAPYGVNSTIAPGDVVFRLLHRRVGEQGVGVTELDQLAHVHEGGVIRDPRRLLHVVGDDDDGVLGFQFVDQFFDLEGGDRIQRRAGFVEQQH